MAIKDTGDSANRAVLVIMPGLTEPQKTCPSGRFWIVEPGDTFYLIASFVGTTTAELKQLNPGIDPANLQIGQQICLPPERVCPSGVFWQVAPGDTLYTIALATGTTLEKLLELNPNVNPLKLLPGQTICLPG